MHDQQNSHKNDGRGPNLVQCDVGEAEGVCLPEDPASDKTCTHNAIGTTIAGKNFDDPHHNQHRRPEVQNDSVGQNAELVEQQNRAHRHDN
jgi:hypothetical protein